MDIPRWAIAGYIHGGPWWRNRSILALNLCLLLPIATATVNGLDSSLVNGLQMLPEWQDYFQHPSGKSLGLINSAQVIGSFLSMPFTPLVSDGLGRRKAIALGSTIMLGGVVLQVLSKNSSMLIGSRVIVGFGLSFAVNAAPLLITELAYPTQRGKITSVFNISWYIGSIISAWTCYGAYRSAGRSSWSWRFPTLAQCMLPLLQIILVWFIPESPRWLMSQGREVEASSILSRFHANNGGEHDPLVVFEMAEIQHAIRIEKEIHAGSSWLCLVATPGNRKRMMIVVALAVFSQWSGNDLVSYYLHLILEGIGMTNPSTQAAINGGLQVFNLVAAMIGSFLVDRLGRRTLFIISNTGMLISFLAWTITTALFNTVHGDAARDAAAKATIPFIFVFFFFYDIGYTPMVVAYMIEILPYNIRARGFVVMGGVVCLVQAVNQFINPWVLDAMGWKYYLVYCVWLMLELAFILKYIIETKGRTLEETAALFDSEAPSQDLVQRGGEAATITVAPVIEDPFKKSKLQFGTFGTFGMLEGSSRVTKVEFHELKLTTTESTIYRSKFTNS